MLFLLLRTRRRYYRNYLRHHFDPMVWLEIGAIILILFYLVGRSPADIGYNLKVLIAKDFHLKYSNHWVTLLPIFYLSVEALALITLRPSGELQMLGASHFEKNHHELSSASSQRQNYRIAACWYFAIWGW